MYYFFIILISFFLASCGGGSSSSESAVPASIISTPIPSPMTPTPATPTPVPPTPTPIADFSDVEFLSGGEASTGNTTDDAFSQSPEAIASNFRLDANFKQGNFLFRGSHADQGPLLNNPTCQGCHIKDGRGNPPSGPDQPLRSMLLKLNVDINGDGNTRSDPIYGNQLQTFAVNAQGQQQVAQYRAALDSDMLTGEARVVIEYENIEGQYADGESYQLQRPVYKLLSPAYGDFAEGLRISPRVASSMIGLGLLEAIPEADIRALADENDTNNDGISGRVVTVLNTTTGQMEIGRFGWKSSTASVLQQSANAYRGDIGITNRFAQEENCTAQQALCNERAALETNTGDALDFSDIGLAFVEFYSRLLAVPQRRGFNLDTGVFDEGINRGREQFESIGCAMCHVRQLSTGEARESALGSIVGVNELAIENTPIDVLSDQIIWPHTDMLLHDMGGSCANATREDMAGNVCDTGEQCAWVFRCTGLADGFFDGEVTGSEWRTAPLWGLGLVQFVNPRAGFLHDGRARTIEEAILWHDGEAQAARNNFTQLDASARDELLAFLRSL